MEVVGLAFGGLGLLGLISTVESAVKCYERFVVSAREAPQRSERFAINVRIEQRKFLLYWEYMGLSESGCPLLEEQSLRTQQLIVDVTRAINELLSDANTLSERYGFEKVSGTQDIQNFDATGGPSSAAQVMLAQVGNTAASEFSQRANPLPKLSRSQTFLWKWKDEKKSMDMLSELRSFNDHLWTSLAPHHEILLRQGEPAWILPGLNDILTLQCLEGEQETLHPGRPLAFCSALRTASLQSDTGIATVPFHSTAPLGLRIDRTGPNVGPLRYLGTLNNQSVIVEYKRIDDTMPVGERELCRQRLLALMKLFLRDNHPSLRTLRGVSVFFDGTRRSEFGLVFEFPSPISGPAVTIVTLESLLASRENGGIEALGRRFRLAQALAKSLMFLHASGWYHKGLKPEAIVFQKIGNSPVDITEPRLMGFEFSRPNREHELSLDNRGVSELNLYTHPERQSSNPPRFRVIHDYYSLGMCLIAIGWWRPISTLERGFMRQPRTGTTGRTPFEWQTYIMEQASTLLKSLCGELYADAVLACLTGNLHPGPWSQGDGQESGSQKAFFAQVIQKLETCRA